MSNWRPIKSDKAALAKFKKISEVVFPDQYSVVIGFEVNNEKAFKDNPYIGKTHNLDEDFGHAFFYTVKNKRVTRLFSFGPTARGKQGWFDNGNGNAPNNWNTGAILKDGYTNSRPATTMYAISESTQLFPIEITQQQYEKLLIITDKTKMRVDNDEQRYTAYANDTCAYLAHFVITEAGIDVPPGKGAVEKSGYAVWYGVNPYMWHHKSLEKYPKPVYFDGDVDFWKKILGKIDPTAKVN